MKTEQEIEALTNQALNSLDKVQPVAANDFLYAKVKNRLQQNRRDAAARHTRVMFRLSAALLLFVCINCASFYAVDKWQQVNQQPQKKLSGAAAVNEAYFLADNNTYSY